MFQFLAPILSAASTFFGTKAGVAVAAGAATSAVNAIAQADADKKRNAAAEAAYQRQLAQQQKERERQAAIDAANKSEQLAIDEKNRATAKADAANKYVDMNAAAEKAGLNPLTVLRATGGTGFGAYGGYGAVMRQGLVQPTISAPILSSTSVATQIGLGAVKGFIDYKTNEEANKHYDRLNKLDLEQRQLDINLSKKALGAVDKPQAQSVPLIDPSTGKQVVNKSGPVFVDAVAQEAMPKYRTVYDQATGKTYAIINPEITEMGGPFELMVSQGILATAETSAEKATGVEYRIPGTKTSVGWPKDPMGFNKGFTFPKGDNTQYAKPQLSF
jgi:hypothetical protein